MTQNFFSEQRVGLVGQSGVAGEKDFAQVTKVYKQGLVQTHYHILAVIIVMEINTERFVDQDLGLGINYFINIKND